MIGKEVRVGACLFVGDMDNMVRFYRDTLGFHTQWNGGDFAEFETASGHYLYLCIAGKHSCRLLERATFLRGESIRHLK